MPLLLLNWIHRFKLVLNKYSLENNRNIKAIFQRSYTVRIVSPNPKLTSGSICAINKTVMAKGSAMPSMLHVAPIGRTKRVTRLSIFALDSINICSGWCSSHTTVSPTLTEHMRIYLGRRSKKFIYFDISRQKLMHLQSHQALHFLSSSFKLSRIIIHKMFSAFDTTIGYIFSEARYIKESEGLKQKTEKKIP